MACKVYDTTATIIVRLNLSHLTLFLKDSFSNLFTRNVNSLLNKPKNGSP